MKRRTMAIALALGAGVPHAAAQSIKVTQSPCDPKEFAKNSYQVESKTDDFDGYTKTVSSRAPLEGGVGRGTFLAQRFVTKDGDESYQLFVLYVAKEWLFIREGESLRFKLGDSTVSLKTETDPDRDVLGGGSIFESAMYETDLDFIARLANSHSGAVVRVYGRQSYEEFEFSKKTLCALRRFVAKTDSTLLR